MLPQFRFDVGDEAVEQKLYPLSRKDRGSYGRALP